jgi:hypothetical protein
MILERGDMWSVFFDTDVFMITTNPIIRKDGAVVMGRGIAAEAKDRYPDLPYDFAASLSCYGNEGVDFIGYYEYTRIYYFMVKDHWAKSAEIEIIRNSVNRLKYLFGYSDERVDLNFPGIGNGGLPRDHVLPFLQDLPDNIHIWERE